MPALRSKIIRLAASLPKRSTERRALLEVLAKPRSKYDNKTDTQLADILVAYLEDYTGQTFDKAANRGLYQDLIRLLSGLSSDQVPDLMENLMDARGREFLDGGVDADGFRFNRNVPRILHTFEEIRHVLEP